MLIPSRQINLKIAGLNGSAKFRQLAEDISLPARARRGGNKAPPPLAFADSRVATPPGAGFRLGRSRHAPPPSIATPLRSGFRPGCLATPRPSAPASSLGHLARPHVPPVPGVSSRYVHVTLCSVAPVRSCVCLLPPVARSLLARSPACPCPSGRVRTVHGVTHR